MKVISKKQELKDVTITHVSYVKRGANKKTFLMSKSEESNPDVEFDVRVVKDDESTKRLLYGIVYEPDTTDAHGDLMNAEEIEKTAHEFMVYYRNIDSEHNLIAGAGQVVESYIAPADMEIGKSTVKKGSWILVTKANDEIWQDYINGDVTGYSMFGIARTTVAKTEEEPKVSWVQKFLEKLGVVKSFEDTLNDHVEAMKQDPGFILYMMEENWFRNMTWDTTRDEDLAELSKSMKEAAVYIDEILAGRNDVTKSVTKSEDEQTQVTDGVIPTPEIPSQVIEEKPEVVVPVIETEPDIPEEPEVDEEKELLKAEIAKKDEEYAILKAEFDKSKVNSAVVSPIETFIAKQEPKPKLF
jgi:hypothetical protein